jgi:hypothetical protein
MWRFYALAAVLVLAFGSIAFALRFGHPARQQHAASHDRVHPAASPVVGLPGGVVGRATPAPAFVGSGGWVLSALPECFDQKSSIEGPSQALFFHIPPARERIAPGTVFQRGRCTVHVRDDDLWVQRGPDRLQVPPSARLYRTPAGLVLVYEHDGNAEVRRY